MSAAVSRSNPHRLENLCGPVGAFLARALAGTLGLAAHVLPFAALVGAVRYLRGLRLRPRWIPAVAWSVSWIALAGLFQVIHAVFPSPLPARSGGLVGEVLVSGLTALLYLPGTALVLSIALCVALLVATGGSVRDAGARGARTLARLGRALSQRAVVGVARLRRRWERAVERREKARPVLGVAPAGGARRGRRPSEPEVVEHRVETPRPARQASNH